MTSNIQITKHACKNFIYNVKRMSNTIDLYITTKELQYTTYIYIYILFEIIKKNKSINKNNK